MSMLKRAAIVLGATGAAVALTFALSGPASADVTYYTASSVSANGYVANACDVRFYPYGEHFYLDDNAKDNAGCYGEWWTVTGPSQHGYMHNSGGVGSTASYNESIPEGTEVKFQACVEDNGFVYAYTCDNWVYGVA